MGRGTGSRDRGGPFLRLDSSFTYILAMIFHLLILLVFSVINVGNMSLLGVIVVIRVSFVHLISCTYTYVIFILGIILNSS